MPISARARIPARRSWRTVVAFALALVAGTAGALPQHAPVPGGVAVVRLGAAAGGPPTVAFDGRPQAVVRDRGEWVALVGIPLDAAAGEGELSIGAAGAVRTLRFAIREKRYPEQRLRIPDRKMVEPPPELAQRIAAEQERLKALKGHFSPEPEPETAFRLPADGRLSARFGGRRVLNGLPRAPHSGLDVAVGAGSPVRAAAAGTVIAAEDFYFAGRTVVVDHGRGLLTLYAHLSRIDVVPGQRLAGGETLGLSGASGRATGPHLHWGVMLGGGSVDPELFLAPRQ